MNRAAISLQGINKSYSRNRQVIPVLQGLDFTAPSGKTIAITGPSGSGKSTLLGLLAGLDHPDSGIIELGGEKISGMSEESLTRFRAAKVGIVFQQFHLLQTLTALENVALPLEIAGRPGARDEARRRLEAVGLAGRANHLPGEMSGGECQRVAIARALVVKPQILLADEPSGNLDNKTGERITELLFDLVRQEGTTLILVTHNEDLARRCDLRFHLREGKLHQASDT